MNKLITFCTENPDVIEGNVKPLIYGAIGAISIWGAVVFFAAIVEAIKLGA